MKIFTEINFLIKVRLRLGWKPSFSVEDGLYETAVGLLKGDQK